MDNEFSKVKKSLAKFDQKTYNAMAAAMETLTLSLESIIRQNLIYFLPKYYDKGYYVSVYQILKITQQAIRVEVCLDADDVTYETLTIPVELVTKETKLKAVVATKEKEMEQKRHKAEEKQKADKEKREHALYLKLKRKYEPEPKSIGGQDDRI